MVIEPKGPPLSDDAVGLILQVTQELARPLDLNTMLGHVIDAARTVLKADRGTVFLYDAAADELCSTVATGVAALRFPADKGIIGECAQTRRLVNVPDCYADPRFNRDADRSTGYRTRCLLTMPLVGYDDSLIGILQVLNKIDGVFTEEDERVGLALAAQCAVAIQRMQMLAELVESEKLKHELQVARDIQMRVLPTALPETAGYDLAGWCRPAAEAGGDIFDVIRIDGDRLMLLLGDATGHGVGPALSVTQVRAMLRMAMRLGADLDAAFENINHQLADDLPDNRFVTAFIGLLDIRNHRVLYHSGGQGPLLHFHAATGECEWRGSSTAPMGLVAGLPPGEPRTLDPEPGDILGLLTDGIYEYESPQHEPFGQDRVADIVRAHHNGAMTRLVDAIVKGVERFAKRAPQNDDMTILLVRRLPK